MRRPSCGVAAAREPKGVLKVNAPMSFGTLYLGPAIAEFMTRYPGFASS